MPLLDADCPPFRGLAAWVLLAGMTAGLGGCSYFSSDLPVFALRQRIMPPPDSAAFLPPPPPPTPQPQSEELPAPRKLPGPAEEKAPSAEAEEAPEQPTPDAPLSLDQAVELALRLSPTLQVMQERIGQAEGGQQVAYADFMPESHLSYRYFMGTPPSEPFGLPTLPTDILGNIAPTGTSDRFSRTELNVQWTVWDFGRRFGKLGQAKAAVDIARFQYLRMKQTVAFNVAVAYFALLQARANNRIAEEAVRQARSVLRDARNFLKRGTAIRNDVLRTEVLLADMELSLVRSRTAQAAAVAQLNQAIGLNVSSPTDVIDLPGEPPFDKTLADCLQTAADNREEFQVVLRSIRSAQLGTNVAQADFFPKILVGGVGLHQAAAGLKDVNLASGGLSIDLALFEGGRRLGRLHTAEAQTRTALAQGKEICDRIAYEVNLAYLAIVDARQRIGLSRTAVQQANENLRVVRSLFQRGDATPTDIVDAELAAIRAEQNYFTSLYDYQTGLARLAYAVGVPAPAGIPAFGDGCHE